VTLSDLAAVFARRWRLAAVTFGICLTLVVAVTLALPKSYKATAVLSAEVAGRAAAAGVLSDPQAAEELVRTYAALAANPNVADAVRIQLPGNMSRHNLLGRMSFAPIERTHLLQLSASARSRSEARLIADTYARVFAQRTTARAEAGRSESKVTVAEPASLPDEAYKPDPPLYIGLGGVLAALLALAAALIRDRIDNRIDVSDDDETIFDEPILARIPRFGARRDALGPLVGDVFRRLRANIDLTTTTRPRVVMITSPRALEGKSTVCARLALEAAAHGERVALVEGDLRRPRLAAALFQHDPVPRDVGLTSCLTGAADWRDVADTSLTSNLTVIWSGPPPPNPGPLLESPRMSELLSDLRHEFDRVIIDTPPVSVGADATLLTRHVDGVLYLLDVNSTRRGPARAGLAQLRSVRAPLIGVVLNRVAGDPFSGYYSPIPGDSAGLASGRGAPGSEERESGAAV
jgi:capsular exopolysaccharide synthesis family protein